MHWWVTAWSRGNSGSLNLGPSLGRGETGLGRSRYGLLKVAEGGKTGIYLEYDGSEVLGSILFGLLLDDPCVPIVMRKCLSLRSLDHVIYR